MQYIITLLEQYDATMLHVLEYINFLMTVGLAYKLLLIDKLFLNNHHSSILHNMYYNITTKQYSTSSLAREWFTSVSTANVYTLTRDQPIMLIFYLFCYAAVLKNLTYHAQYNAHFISLRWSFKALIATYLRFLL